MADRLEIKEVVVVEPPVPTGWCGVRLKHSLGWDEMSGLPQVFWGGSSDYPGEDSVLEERDEHWSSLAQQWPEMVLELSRSLQSIDGALTHKISPTYGARDWMPNEGEMEILVHFDDSRIRYEEVLRQVYDHLPKVLGARISLEQDGSEA